MIYDHYTETNDFKNGVTRAFGYDFITPLTRANMIYNYNHAPAHF